MKNMLIVDRFLFFGSLFISLSATQFNLMKKKKKKKMFLLNIFFFQLTLKYILIFFIYIHIQCTNIFMDVIPIVYLVFIYQNIGYFDIFLVISVNHFC